MPQFVPFFFISQFTVTIFSLFILTYILGKIFLPIHPITYVSRMYVSKL
jgi:Fungal ATP synthase protein 8 (A6L)